MRARDSKRQADELAAVVRWLRARAAGCEAVAERLAGESGPEAVRIRRACKAQAATLNEAAIALELGEHHAPV